MFSHIMAISMESSPRDLLTKEAEHRATFKNNLNTYYSRFIFTPKTGKNSPKYLFRFYCEPTGCRSTFFVHVAPKLAELHFVRKTRGSLTERRACGKWRHSLAIASDRWAADPERATRMEN